MNYLKFALVLSTLCVLGLSRVEAASRQTRESEAPTVAEETNAMGKMQDQLKTALDSFKKTMEGLVEKFNVDELAQGFQNFTQQIENYAAEAAAKLAASQATTETEPKKE